MTKIFGVLYLDDAPLSAGLEQMIGSLAKEPSDSSGTWQDGPVALGQQTLHTTPESLKEELPFHQIDTGLTIAGDIRLDNRKELFAKLAIPKHEHQTRGDAQLVLAAYLKWGEACPVHLLGDFAFVIWDNKNQKLFCCIDHMGMCRLFYYFDDKKFVFATDADTIMALPGVKTGISYNKLATIVDESAKHLFWEESWFENISRFQGGTVITNMG